MPNQAQLALGDSGAAPQTYKVPKAQQVRVICANARYNGAAAAGNFLPAVELVSDAGEIVARCIGSQVLAGDSADVTFGAFLGNSDAIRFGVFNRGSFLDVQTADYIDFKGLNFTAEMLNQPNIRISENGLGVDVVAVDQTFTQNPSVTITAGGNLDLTAGSGTGNNPIFMRLDGASGAVPPHGSVRVFFGAQELFRINQDGSLQGRTGKALVFNL